MTGRNPIKNAELLMLQQEAKQRFDKILLDIQVLPEIRHDPFVLKQCRDFRYCLKPLKCSSVADLPYYAPRPETWSPDKILCVLSVISCAVQSLWELYAGNKFLVSEINTFLDRLEGYIQDGLDAYEVVGEKYDPGFWLEKK